jgi:hypothetical protein
MEVFTMNNLQKENIRKLRNIGNSYLKISEMLNLPLGTIKSYCSRNGIKINSVIPKDTCMNCGASLVQKAKQKPRKFCCDNCRMSWWSNNREHRKSKGDKYQCEYCDKTYESYDTSSKYCGHPCYIADRFSEGEKANG